MAGIMAFAQDIHFSQFNSSLLNLSPAYTGFFDGDYRVSSVYRSQWASVPVSYSTFNINGEARLQPDLRKKDMVGVGIMFNNDKAGDAQYGSNQLYLSGSYMHLLKADSTLIFSYGANVGFCNVGFDYSKMTFDNQYNEITGFDNSISNGENFGRTRKSFADFNIGFGLQYVYKYIHQFSFATGLHHLSRPTVSYQGNDVSKIDIKTTNCLAYTTPISENTDIVAEALLTFQGKNYELIPHISLKYFTNRPYNQAILGGVCFRARDAVVFRLGYYYKTLQSGMAYDVNFSRFNAATNRRGAFEVFVNYVFKKGPGFVAKKRNCPAFM